MLLFARDVAGRTFAVDVDPDGDIAGLSRQIAAVRGSPVGEECLIYGGRSLGGKGLISSCGLSQESTVFLSPELLGGAKKRKKKTYTKPKKIKHKRKKVKLAVLKFYKVDSNDKVTR